MAERVEILGIGDVTHDVKRFVTTRPDGFDFEPGQATEMTLTDPEWADEGRPFTFTSLPADPKLEFTIKGYPDHDGVTKRLHALSVGDHVELSDVFGAITWKGPGVFIAGGAGVTPFIAILRHLEKTDQLQGNRLLFSNKTEADIILREEFIRMLGDNAKFTLTREEHPRYEHGRIDQAFLENHIDDFSQKFYTCGPPEMVEDVAKALEKLGASTDAIVIEE